MSGGSTSDRKTGSWLTAHLSNDIKFMEIDNQYPEKVKKYI